MKIKICLLCAALCLLLVGCAPQSGDYLAPFRGGFSAELAGEWRSIAFEGRVEASAPDGDGARVMTLTFYAPQSLCGTVLTREKAGGLVFSLDGVSVPLTNDAAAGYAALFALFPTAGEIRSVSRENGNTRLDGAGFSLLLAPDGTPLAAENAAARVEMRAFVAEK